MTGYAKTGLDSFNGLRGPRLVNFVVKSGTVRPMLVVMVWLDFESTLEDPASQILKPTGVVNGIVFRDGSNDDANFPQPPVELKEGEIPSPVQVRLAEWFTSVKFDANKVPGTWHWPDKPEQPAFVTQAQLATMLEEHEGTVEIIVNDVIGPIIKQIRDTFAKHGMNMPEGPATSLANEAEALAEEGIEIVAGTHVHRGGDTIVQAPHGQGISHAPQGENIGQASAGANPGADNAKVLADAVKP